MKIAFMIPTFYPVVGGAQNNCYHLARELAKKHDVSVYCSGDEDETEVVENINVFRCKVTACYSYYLTLYPSLSKILKEDFDIIHIHGLGFVQQDDVIKKIKKHHPKTKLVCTPHGPFMALKYGFIKTMIKKLYTRVVKKVVKELDVIIQVNPYQHIWMEKEYNIPNKKIKLLPNGITTTNTNTFGIPSKLPLYTEKIQKIEEKYELKDKFVITYVGRIQKYKGLDQVIKAIPKLHKNITFVAIGKDAGDQQRLQNLAKELGVEKQVIFTGFINEEEKLGLLEISKIYVFPSEWEAFGIGTLEAMSKGCAIISTKTEGGKYLIGIDNGRLFDYGDIEGLKTQLEKLIYNEKERIRISTINVKKAEKFKWEEIVKELEEIYTNIK